MLLILCLTVFVNQRDHWPQKLHFVLAFSFESSNSCEFLMNIEVYEFLNIRLFFSLCLFLDCSCIFSKRSSFPVDHSWSCCRPQRNVVDLLTYCILNANSFYLLISRVFSSYKFSLNGVDQECAQNNLHEVFFSLISLQIQINLINIMTLLLVLIYSVLCNPLYTMYVHNMYVHIRKLRSFRVPISYSRWAASL